VPPAELVARAGYQVHLSGNVSFGDFTNRLKFNGQIKFNNLREWREFNLKIVLRLVTVDIHSLATNGTVHVKISNEGAVIEHDFTFADLQNPATVIRVLLGDAGDTLLGGIQFPQLTPAAAAQNIQWTACRTRVRIGSEAVPVYRLEAAALGSTVSVDVSTLGEILNVQLPGNLSARIDEWSKP